MKNCNKILERIIPTVLLFLLSLSSAYAIKKGNAPTFNLSDLEAKRGAGPAVIPLSFWLILGGIAFCIVGGFFALRRFQAMKEQEVKDKVAYDQALLGLESELESLKVTPQNREALHILGNTEDPQKLLPIIKSNELFEKLFSQLKKDSPDPKEVHMIHELRHALNFSFQNKKLPFVCTQMLPLEMKLECEIAFKGKNIVFLSHVLETTEETLLLKPPMVKGRPANLRQFPAVTCRLRREKDADYQFTLKILDQSLEENSVILAHTRDIRKMAIRDSERIPMDVDISFHVIHKDQYEMGEDFEFQAGDSSSKIEGNIADMSSGGVKINFSQMPQDGITPDHILLFHLKYASLRRNLVGEVLNVLDRKQYHTTHLRFKDNDTLTRMRLSQYLHRAKKTQSADLL